ncbi:LysR family transcriptional regulator [Olleya sp. R77988]|uniref:LysR family transcriptional regulator n=1 Tax=Olleya sp. R77988 TaxID=3093875 RepID=UPI0037C6BDCE
MTNQIEIRHLQYFLALADSLHYRLAAENLFISQSALSQQIQRLEIFLGEKLFKRHNRKVALTQSGEFFREEALIIINQLNTSMERWRYRVEGGEGILKIGFVASAMYTFLPKVIKRFSDECPGIKFHLEELSNKNQLDALDKKQLDICFVRSKKYLKDMKNISVFKENLTLVLPDNHPINKKNFKNIAQLKDESFILFPNNQSDLYYQQILNLCNEHDFTPQIKHRSIHGPTIFKLVESGLGVSIIPNSLKDVHNSKVKYIELKKIKQKTELFAVWSTSNDNISLRHFLKNLKENIS